MTPVKKTNNPYKWIFNFINEKKNRENMKNKS